MGFGPFPKEPAKRKVLVIVDEHDLERLEYEGGSNVLLDGNSWIINSDDPPESDIIITLDHMNLMAPGQVLIQNPYRVDRYLPIENATADIAATKHHLFASFCHLLGAKRVSVKQGEVITVDGSTTLKVEGGRLGFSGEGKAEYKDLRRLGQQMTISMESSGGQADLAAAEKFLHNHRLIGDQHLLSLIEMCKHDGNVLQKHIMTLSLTDQAKTNLIIAAKLKAPTFSFSAEIERATSRSFDFNLTLEVEF